MPGCPLHVQHVYLCRCLECIEAGAVEGALFSNFIWACSEWGHQLQHSELEQLVPAAVDSICADWPDPGRGGALLLGEGLTRQVSALLAKQLHASVASAAVKLPFIPVQHAAAHTHLSC